MNVALHWHGAPNAVQRRAALLLLARTHLWRTHWLPADTPRTEAALLWLPPDAPSAPRGVRIAYRMGDGGEGARDRVRALLRIVRASSTAEELRTRLFQHDTNGARCEYDLFEAALWIIDRMEERGSDACDEHGRFPHTASILHEEGLLDEPVVDRIAFALGEELARFGGYRDRPNASVLHDGAPFAVAVSLDIDSAGMFGGAAALRNLRAAAAQGRLLRALGAAAVSLPLPRYDPHLQLHTLGALLEGLGIRGSIFVQTHRWHRLDNYILRKGSLLARRILAMEEAGHEIGLHSSYATEGQPARIEEQWTRLRDAVPGAVPIHRAHYLRFGIEPAAGGVVDSSIGYGSACGFRMGTALPLPLAEGAMEVPPCAMDSTLRFHERLDPERATERMIGLLDRVHRTGGVFTPVWHPHNLEPILWPGWIAAMTDTLAEARRRGACFERISVLAQRAASAHESIRIQLEGTLPA